MLEVFTRLADWLIYRLAGLDPQSKFGTSLHFFVEDTTKTFALLIVMIYVIALMRASLNSVYVLSVGVCRESAGRSFY